MWNLLVCILFTLTFQAATHTDHIVDRLVDTLVDRAHEESPAHSAGLDDVALGKSALTSARARRPVPVTLSQTGPRAVSSKATAPAGTGHSYKVVVCGGSGGIGQPLALLMALNPLVKELCVMDVNKAAVTVTGVAADLDHLEVGAKVKGYEIDAEKPAVDQLEECLTGADLVLVSAGVPRKPGMTRDDLFAINAGIAKGLLDAFTKWSPQAILGIIVNPVNSIVPAMGELYAKRGLDPMRVVGVTTLDCVRANKFVAGMTGTPVEKVQIPVVGGHAGKTILPLFSQDGAGKKIDPAKLEELDKRLQEAGTEVVNAKAGKGSATLAMAYAGARFGDAVLRGLAGTPNTECAYVKSNIFPDLPYFASKVTFGPKGVEQVHDLGTITDYEKARLSEVSAQLKADIAKGLEYSKGVS